MNELKKSSGNGGCLGVMVLVIAALFGSAWIYGEIKPNYAKKSYVVGEMDKLRPLMEYHNKSGKFPDSLDELGLQKHSETEWDIYDDLNPVRLGRQVILKDNRIDVVFENISPEGDATMIFIPKGSGAQREPWNCTGGTLEDKFRPKRCQKG